MKKFLLLLLLLPVGLALPGCQSAYYGAMEKAGYAKRDILVSRVEKAQEAQADAKEQFADALQAFLAVTRVEGGELRKKYDELNAQLKRSETRAKAVHERIAAIDAVATALFEEWGNELALYSNPELRTRSQEQFAATRTRYTDLMATMRRAAARMEPVLVTFRDQVLFLKHNLNAQSLRALDATNRSLQGDISTLIAEMEKSMREADSFIRELKLAP